MNKVYPIGYSLYRSQERVEELMADPAVLLVDCRITPWSERKEWREESLRAKYGKRYRAAGQFLGNALHHLNKQPGPGWPAPHKALIRIAQPKIGIHGLCIYLKEGYDIILLCGCRDYENCHLKTVVDLLQEKRPEVVAVGSNGKVIRREGTIKALSIWEPYASWIANPQWFQKHGIPPKVHENRDWSTSYRGSLLIHASQGYDKKAIKFWAEEFEGFEGVVPSREEYRSGTIVGIADLIEIVEESDNPWFLGEYGWVLADARPIKPISYRGQPGLFDVPISVLHGLPLEPKIPLLLDAGPLDREEL